jgi:hypothetical protein
MGFEVPKKRFQSIHAIAVSLGHGGSTDFEVRFETLDSDHITASANKEILQSPSLGLQMKMLQ